jgi:hypothetical protein
LIHVSTQKEITIEETNHESCYRYDTDSHFYFVCLFVYSHTSNISAIWRVSPLSVTGLQILVYARCSGIWAGRDLLRATPTATRDLGLYGLIRKTGTYVPQWDLNPGRKDHQIIAPDALTTAPRRWLIFRSEVVRELIMYRYRHDVDDIDTKRNHIRKPIMSRCRYDIDSQFYLTRSEVVWEPIMNRYRHEKKWQNRSWVGLSYRYDIDIKGSSLLYSVKQ